MTSRDYRDTSQVLVEEAQCIYGYPLEQLERLLGETRMEEYRRWGAGNTGAICDGQRWNPMSQQYEDTECGPHGLVVYPWDVRSFLAGLPNVD